LIVPPAARLFKNWYLIVSVSNNTHEKGSSYAALTTFALNQITWSNM